MPTLKDFSEMSVKEYPRGLGREPGEGEKIRGFGMEPKAQWIEEIAMLDPIAAYGLVMGVPRIPISINASGSFSSFALNQIPIQAGLDTTIAQRTWIDNITFDISLPNVFQGQILVSEFMAYLRQNPGIGVRLTVHSGPRYLVSPQFTPLNNFVNILASRWQRGWPLFKQQNIEVEFELVAGIVSGLGEENGPPYNVVLTFNGWQFLDHTVDEISVDTAARKLREMGFWLPRAVECP
jgi:hypothetical protein